MTTTSARRVIGMAMALAACGGDGGAAGDTSGDTVFVPGDATLDGAADSVADAIANDTGAPDASDGTGATDSAPDTLGPDVVMCGSEACVDRPAPGCSPDKLSRWSYTADPFCQDDAGGFPMCVWPLTDARCLEGEACRVEGDSALCAAPRDTCEVALSRFGTWISAARLPSGDDDACCFDFDGDGTVDNGLAELAQSVAGLFDSDPQAFIDAFVERALNAYLLQYTGLDSVFDDAGLRVDVLVGYDKDGDPTDNRLGTERFLVRTGSYDGPNPVGTLASSVIADGVLSGRSATMRFPMPLTADLFIAEVRDVRLEGQVYLGANGRGLTLEGTGAGGHGARFGALFPLAEVYRAVNAFAHDTCTCLDTAGADLVSNADGFWQCHAADSAACNPADPDEARCIDLAAYCSAAILLLRPDVGDAFSVGLWLEGVSAGFDGFVTGDDAPPECP